MKEKTLNINDILSPASIVTTETYHDYIKKLASKVFIDMKNWSFEAEVNVYLKTGRYHSFTFAVKHSTLGVLAVAENIEDSDPYSRATRKTLLRTMKRARKAAAFMAK